MGKNKKNRWQLVFPPSLAVISEPTPSGHAGPGRFQVRGGPFGGCPMSTRSLRLIVSALLAVVLALPSSRIAAGDGKTAAIGGK